MPRPSPRCPRRSGGWVGCLAVLALVSLGCSSPSTEDPSSADPSVTRSDGWAARLRDPSIEIVLEALGQPHASIRDELGPHRVRWTADFALRGSDSEAIPAEALPAVDTPAVVDEAVHDEVELLWTPSDDGLPRLRLQQANDKDRGREIVVVDGRVHWRDLHRPWQHHPLESDLHERWLDEAQRAVHDVVELAAVRIEPKAQLDEAKGTITVELTMTERSNPALRRDAPTARWRASAEIERVAGRIVFDASSGSWRTADVTVQYALQAADGRTLRGTVHLEGEVEPLAPGGVDIRAPADSQPLTERTRLHAERQMLLDGLAAPR